MKIEPINIAMLLLNVISPADRNRLSGAYLKKISPKNLEASLALYLYYVHCTCTCMSPVRNSCVLVDDVLTSIRAYTSAEIGI